VRIGDEVHPHAQLAAERLAGGRRAERVACARQDDEVLIGAVEPVGDPLGAGQHGGGIELALKQHDGDVGGGEVVVEAIRRIGRPGRPQLGLSLSY